MVLSKCSLFPYVPICCEPAGTGRLFSAVALCLGIPWLLFLVSWASSCSVVPIFFYRVFSLGSVY